jgi:predicted permease
MSSFIRDLSFGFRLLRRSPLYTAIAVATLALGIGANSAVFSVVNAAIVRPLPFHDPNRLALVSIEPNDPAFGTYEGTYDKLRAESQSFEQLAWMFRDTGISRVTLRIAGEPESAQGGFVSASLFPLLGVKPQIGRPLTAADESRRERVVVLSAALWRDGFGGATDVIGQSIQIDDAMWQIVGVMPDSFVFPSRDVRFWAPITTSRFWNDPDIRVKRANAGPGFYARWNVIGRLRRDATFERAQAEVSLIAAKLVTENPIIEPGARLFVTRLDRDVTPTTRLTLALLLGAVATVLLIGCTNVAHLTLARGTARLRELAVRSAIGAARGTLIRQMFAESLALALVAGVAGLLIAMWVTPVLTALGPPEIRPPGDSWIDPIVLGFTAAVSIGTALVFGLVPAWRISRADPIDALKSGSLASGQSTGTVRLRSLLVVTETGLAVVLLAAASLLVRSLLAVRAVDPGFDTDRVLTVRASLPSAAPAARRFAFYGEVQQRIQATPAVNRVGAIDALFESSGVANLGLRAIEGRELLERQQDWSPMRWSSVSGDYFQAIGIPIMRGRSFSSHDGPGSPLVAIVDESAVKRYWPGEDPTGQRFKGQDRRGPNDDWITVVGVAGDARRQGLDRSPIPHVYLPAQQSAGVTPDIVVRTAGDAQAVAAPVRQAIRESDRTAIVSPVTTLAFQLDVQLAPRRFQTWLIGVFAMLALVLAGAGVYGVMHYAVTERRREIAIRVALGAQPAQVTRMAMRQTLALTAGGLIGGLVAAAWVGRLMANLLFGVSAADPVSFAASALLLIAIVIVASWIPARRAALGNPLNALRAE